MRLENLQTPEIMQEIMQEILQATMETLKMLPGSLQAALEILQKIAMHPFCLHPQRIRPPL
jgi:hypothetical protein